MTASGSKHRILLQRDIRVDLACGKFHVRLKSAAFLPRLTYRRSSNEIEGAPGSHCPVRGFWSLRSSVAGVWQAALARLIGKSALPMLAAMGTREIRHANVWGCGEKLHVAQAFAFWNTASIPCHPPIRQGHQSEQARPHQC